MLSKKADKNLIVGLDIGTSKVVAIVGEIAFDGTIEVIGVGAHPSQGLKRGVVVDIESTVQSIQSAVEEAQAMAQCKIHSVLTSIAGNHIHSMNSHGIVAIRNSEVSASDVDRVIDAAKAVAIPADQKILHILPQQFIIDKQTGIRDPLGMSGVRLETKVHMVTGSASAVQNIVKCIRRCNLEVADVVLEQIAAAEAVLTADERDLGVCLLDIGAGTTDIAVFLEGAIQHTAMIPIGGDQVTNDIAVALRVPTQSAETIKIKNACALTNMADPHAWVEVPGVGDRGSRRLSCAQLAEVVEPRYEELFLMIQAELRRHHLEEMIGSGIVITGGGALMPGVIALAEEVFQIPVRLGVPRYVTGLVEVISNPIYATGVGLLLYGTQQQEAQQQAEMPPLGAGAGNAWRRIRRWVQSHF